MPDSASKRCTKCGEVKPLGEFGRLASRPDGHRAECRACRKNYYGANRDRIIAKSARWYRENRQRGLEARRQYREATLETWREYDRQRTPGRSDWKREYDQGYVADLRGVVFAHYGTSCACCGATERLSIDHVGGDGGAHRQELFGRSHGGGKGFWQWLIRHDFPQGYQTLCLPCNQSKGRSECCRLDHGRAVDG